MSMVNDSMENALLLFADRIDAGAGGTALNKSKTKRSGEMISVGRL